MAHPVIMPRQGQSVESCIIGKWHKKKGDKVAVGDVLFTYETDKATFDEESKVEGILLDVFFEEGDDVPCLTNVCVIGNEGESTDEFNPKNAAAAVSEAEKTIKPEVKEEEKPQQPEVQASFDAGGRLKISPRARGLAERQGVDCRYATPTGPGGRVIERDVRALIENGVMATPAAMGDYKDMKGRVEGTGIGGRVTTADIAAASASSAAAPVLTPSGAEFEEVKHTTIRKSIAKAMHQSLSEMAQLTLNSSFDASCIMSFRESVKAGRESMGIENITLNDIILFAVSRTLLNHRECNAHYFDDKMVYFNNVHLGVAVDTPRGLMVPTLRYANLKSLNQISKEAKGLIEQCKKGSINPDLLKGGTFTVTNLGSLGVESFTPVINPPQTCILGVNTIETKVKNKGGEYTYYPAMSLSLTFDHRALDGAPAARFLKELVSNLENFTLLLAK